MKSLMSQKMNNSLRGHKVRKNKFYQLCIALFVIIGSSPLAYSASEKTDHLAWSCFSCHGVDGASKGPAIPAIAGLSRNYIIGTMLSYKFSSDLEKAYELLDSKEDLEDVVVNKRNSATMNRIAEGYSLSEIIQLANYFSDQKIVKPEQVFDEESAKIGKKLHKKYCEKCHEDWGANATDDVGLLAGQWKHYLAFSFEDFNSGDRDMPKKMKKKMDKMQDKKGAESIDHLINFYASQR